MQPEKEKKITSKTRFYQNLHPAQDSQGLPKVQEYLTLQSHQELLADQEILVVQEHLIHPKKPKPVGIIRHIDIMLFTGHFCDL